MADDHKALRFALASLRNMRQELAWALESLERLPQHAPNSIDRCNLAAALDHVRAAVKMADRRLAYVASKYDEGTR